MNSGIVFVINLKSNLAFTFSILRGSFSFIILFYYSMFSYLENLFIYIISDKFLVSSCKLGTCTLFLKFIFVRIFKFSDINYCLSKFKLCFIYSLFLLLFTSIYESIESYINILLLVFPYKES